MKRSRSRRLPPGPKGLPIIGNLHQLSDSPHRDLMKLAREHGPLMYIQMGCKPNIVVSSPKLAEEVLKTKDIETAGKPDLVVQRKLTYNYQDLVFAPYGEYWRHIRKISRLELFTAKRVQTFRPVREEEVAKLIESISISAKEGAVVNLSKLTLALTNTMICKVSLGRKYGDEIERSKCEAVLGESLTLFARFFAANYFPMLWWVDVLMGMSAKLERCFVKSDKFFEAVIDEHLLAAKDANEPEDFVDVLLRVQNEFSLTREQMKGVLLNIFIAGSDTSASLMVWVMAELERNPRVKIKAREEIRGVVGRKGKVEESDIMQLPYLNAIIKEALRLHPSAPLLFRETIQKCTIGGYEIEPKTTVLINAFAIARDPKLWDNPEEFLPERFLGSAIDNKGQHFELLSFGSGRRMCPGMLVGLSMTELTLANLLYSFDWDVPPALSEEVMNMTEITGNTIQKKYPLILLPTIYTS